MADQILKFEGKTYRVLGRGIERCGKVYCHLASVTETRQQKNGAVPRQIGEWVPKELLETKA